MEKLTAEQVYDRLVNVDKILEVKGQIKFFLGNVNIIGDSNINQMVISTTTSILIIYQVILIIMMTLLLIFSQRKILFITRLVILFLLVDFLMV